MSETVLTIRFLMLQGMFPTSVHRWVALTILNELFLKKKNERGRRDDMGNCWSGEVSIGMIVCILFICMK